MVSSLITAINIINCIYSLMQRKFATLREGIIHLTIAGVSLMALRLALMGWKVSSTKRRRKKERKNKRPNSSTTQGPLLLFSFSYFVLLLHLFLQAPDFAASDNPASAHPSFITRSLTFLFLPVFNFGLMLYPRWLSFDWYVSPSICHWSFFPFLSLLFLSFSSFRVFSSVCDFLFIPFSLVKKCRSMESIPLLHSWYDGRNFFSLLFYVLLVTFVRHSLQSLISRPGSSHSYRRTTIRTSCHHHSASCYSSSCSSEYTRNGLSKRTKVRNILTPSSSTSTSTTISSSSSASSSSSLLRTSVTTTVSSCSNWKESFFSSFLPVSGNIENNNGTSCNLNNNNNSPYTSCDGEMCTRNQSGDSEVTSESPSGSKSRSSLDTAAGSEDALFMAILLMVFPWLPASNLFFYVGFVVAGQLFLIKCTQKGG